MAAPFNLPASASLWDQIYSEFICSVCFDLFIKPKVLNCDHTFCEHCLEKLIKTNGRDSRCPLCRRQIPVPAEEISLLPDNTFLADTLEQLFHQSLFRKERATIRGEFGDPSGIAVSETGEIFVADYDNQNVQVFTFNALNLKTCTGASDSVRKFPTILPWDFEGQKIYPEDIAMDGEGNLWVVGNVDPAGPGFAVQYNTDGEVMKHFKLPKSRHLRGVAVDTERNHILVTHREGSITRNPTGAVLVYSLDGTLVNTVRPEQGMNFPQYITVEGEGRILVTDEESHSVYVFNQGGQFRSQFSRGRGDDCLLKDPRGICTDSSGNIVVADHDAGRVEMFEKFSGRFFWHIATDIAGPQGVAMLPQGHLVVTDNVRNELTIIFHE
ncbi:E3 ubiquitin-protein ligase TRIM32-like [Branchiostoma floridae x Branchiostoma belcheri]